jgi:hypothetical protein
MDFPSPATPLHSVVSTLKTQYLLTLQSEDKIWEESAKLDPRQIVVFRDFFNQSKTDTSDQKSINPYIRQILAPLHPVEM